MSATRSGIQTTDDGSSYIPASKRSDGSTRKEIRVRPGYRPPEDIDSYKTRTAEAWKNRGKGGVPGADSSSAKIPVSEPKSQNAKRREAARHSKATANAQNAVEGTKMSKTEELTASEIKLAESESLTQKNDDQSARPAMSNDNDEAEAERQKKIRNQLKKLKGVRELKEKKSAGEKLSPDQLMKISREAELVRDLKKLGYDDEDMQEQNGAWNGTSQVVDSG